FLVPAWFQETSRNLAEVKRFRVSKIKLTLADGIVPLGSFEYTVEDLPNGVADLSNLYNSSSRPAKQGDRIVMEVLEMMEMQPDNSVVAFQPSVMPRSIRVR
ncbi:MAG: hypothetical protein AAFQ98_09000, partial [Bacteroidota bacterium]